MDKNWVRRRHGLNIKVGENSLDKIAKFGRSQIRHLGEFSGVLVSNGFTWEKNKISRISNVTGNIVNDVVTYSYITHTKGRTAEPFQASPAAGTGTFR